MDSQTEYVIIVAHVKTLGILLSIVHHSNRGYMVNYLPGLGIKQVTPTIIAPVAANRSYKRQTAIKGSLLLLILLILIESFLCMAVQGQLTHE